MFEFENVDKTTFSCIVLNFKNRQIMRQTTMQHKFIPVIQCYKNGNKRV